MKKLLYLRLQSKNVKIQIQIKIKIQLHFYKLFCTNMKHGLSH
jgi:hypothetical protein